MTTVGPYGIPFSALLVSAGRDADQAGRVEGLRGDDRVAREERLLGATLAVADAHALALVGDLEHLAAGLHAAGELGREAVDERARAADDVAREPAAAAPDEREVARARARGDLLRLGRGARHGGPEHQVGIARELPEPLGERLGVAMCKQPPPRLGGRLAGPRPGDALVTCDRDPQSRSRARERDALGGAQRQAQRIQLGPSADQQAAVELERDEVTGHGQRLHADVGDQAPCRRARAAEDVGAEVHPVGPARLAADAAAGALRALEHDDIAVAQIPGRRQARDAAADDDGVADGLELAAGGVGGQVAESSAGVWPA